jgi:hypothetical protein
VVDPGIVPDSHLGQPEVWALPGVPGHDVVDDDAAVRRCHLGQAAELHVGAEHLVDLRADPVEVPVNAGGRLPAEDPPARFRGPVCTALMPIASNASHSSSSPKVLRKEWPGLVIIEMG